MRQRWMLWWNTLGTRERRMLGGAMGFALIMLLTFGNVEPLWRARARLAEELPQLRAQQLELEALLQEATQLKKSLPALRPQDVMQTLEKSLTASGLRAQRLERDATGEVRVVLTGVEPGGMVRWLERAMRESRLVARSVRIARASSGVDADIVLVLARTQP